MTSPAPSTLRSHVAWLVFATALPLVLFAGTLTYIAYQRQQAAIEDGMIDTARALSLAVDKELEIAIRVLQTMAASEHLTSGDLRQFHAYARNESGALGPWESIVLVDPGSKRILLNSRFAFGTEFPRSVIPEFIDKVARTGEAAVSETFIAPALGRHLVLAAVPVSRGGHVKSVLAASASPSVFLKLLEAQRIAAARRVTITDRNQAIVAQSWDHEKSVGKRASESFAARARQHREASWRGRTPDGYDAVSALSRSTMSGWTVGLATPAEVADAPLRNLLAIAAVGTLLLLGAGLLLAGFIARRVSLAAAHLVDAAQALGRSEVPSPLLVGVAEMHHVGRAIQDAAAERRRMEQTLRESEDRYRDLVEHSQDLICTHDLDGRILSVNPWAAKVLGYEPAEILNMNIRDGIAPELRREVDAYLAKIKAEGAASGIMLVRTRSGEKRLWEYANTLRTDGVAAPIVRGMAHDVTEQRRAERALRKSEERFRSLTELSSDYYWEQDEQYRFVARFGPEHRKSHFPMHEMIGKTRWELPALNFTDADWMKHRAVLEARHEFRDLEIERPLPSGERRWISTSGLPIFDAGGKFRGYHGVAINITERKRDERLRALELAVTRCFAETPDAAQALKGAIKAICESEHWASGRYYFWDAVGGLLRFSEAWGIPDAKIAHHIEVSRGVVYGPGVGLVGATWQSREPLWVPDVASDTRVLRPGAAHEAGIRAALTVPVLAEGKAIGVLIFHSRQVREPDERLLGTIRVIGTQIGQFVQRALAEQALRESETRFKSLTELSSDWYWEQNEEFRFVDFSQSVEARAGSSVASHIGKTRWELPVIGVSDEQWAAHRAMLAAHQAFQDFEFRRATEQGEVIWISASGVPIFDQQGRFKGYRGTARNITERKRADDALRLSEQRFRLAACRGQVWDWNIVENTVTLPFEFWRRLGYDEQDVGDPVAMLESVLHPEDLGRWRQEIKDHISRHLPFESEYRARAKSGAYRWFSAAGQAIWLESGQATYMSGTTFEITERKEAETALRESEARFRSLTELSSDWYWEQDEQFRYTRVGQKLLSIHGIDPAWMMGKTRWEVGIGNLSATEWAAHKKALAEHRAFRDLELIRYNDDGSMKNASLSSGEPLFDAHGAFRGYHGVGHDITDRKQTEEALRNSKEHLTGLIQTVDGIVWEADADSFKFTFVSPRAERLLGYPLARWTAEPAFWADHLHPDDREEAVRYCVQCTREKRDHEFEYRMLAADGRPVWLRDIVTVVVEDERPAKLRGIMVDITERKRAEQALQDQAEHLRMAQRLARMISLEWNIETDRISWSESPEWLLGPLPRSGSYPLFKDMVHQEDRQQFLANRQAALDGFEEHQFDYRIVRTDGAMRWISARGRTIRDASGRAVRMHIVLQDITERKRAEAALRGYAERLETLSRRVLTVQEDERRFLARELHDEIGQALTAVKLGLQSIGGASPAAGAAVADSLVVLNTAIDQVRSLSLDLRPQILDDLGIIAALRWYCRRTAERSDVRVDFQSDPVDLAHSQTLATVCYRVVQEAVTNALRHAHAKRVRVALRAGDGRLRLSIEDDGAGMDLAARRAAAHAGESSGLLSMEERAALAGGRLHLFSQPGEGTRVVAEFRLEETHAAA